MPNVVRFALSSARDLVVPGAGTFHAGILDVDANNLSLVSRTRYLVKPYGAVEVGIVDSATAYPSLPAVPAAPAPDPYPQYVTDADLSNPVSGPSVALRAAFGRAAPVFANPVYETGTGNLLSYDEDGIHIVLTYNSDGTLATSKRGTEPTQTYSYSGGNLVGIA